MKIYYMKQCKLRRRDKTTVSWLPTKFAVKGKILKLKGIDGWVVESVGNLIQPSDIILERSQDYKHQRKVSDI